MMTGMLNTLATMVEVEAEAEEATGTVVLDGDAMPGTCCLLAPWHPGGHVQVARCFSIRPVPHQS